MTMRDIELTLENVAQDFSNWRKTKRSKGETTPAHLWEKVRELVRLKKYSQTTILTALKLSHRQLKIMKLVDPMMPSSQAKNKQEGFVEISAKNTSKSLLAGTPALFIRRREAMLSLQNPTQEQIQQAIEAFVR